jgi:adenosylcobinamide-GDP ribazoletransferase
MLSFGLALQLLTRIPIPIDMPVSDRVLGRSVLFYPLVGLVIGGILVILALTLKNSISIEVQSVLLLISWVLLTGGLHLDGLADCADAWAGGLGDKRRSLAIMKDPAAGPMAVVLLVLVLLLKWSACMQIIAAQNLTVLLITPVIGRLAIMALMLSTPYIRSHGLGAKLQKNIPRLAAILVLVTTLIACLWLIDWTSVLIAILVCMLIRWLACNRIGGATGDVYGAAVELVEVSVLTVNSF